MQREIKFRAWDKISKVMVDLSGFKYVGTTHIQLFYRDEDDCGTTCTVLIENIELMQYTGLHDKNGKEIYEGDICKGRRGGEYYLFAVKWDEVDARFLGHTTNGYICYVGQEPCVEVIGNIYENPELLQEVSQ